MHPSTHFKKVPDIYATDVYLSKQNHILSYVSTYEFEHWHSDYEIIMPLSGSFHIKSPFRESTLSVHDLCLIPNFSLHEISPLTENASMYHVCIQQDLVARIRGYQIIRERLRPFSVFRREPSYLPSETMETLLLSLWNDTKQDSGFLESQFEQQIHRLLMHILREMLKTITDFPSERNTSHQTYILTLCKSCCYMKLHAHEPITVNDLAALTPFKPQYYAVLFHNILGVSWLHYLNHIRIEQCMMNTLEKRNFPSFPLSESSKKRISQSLFGDSFYSFEKKYLQF